jgi:hypothetical protein
MSPTVTRDFEAAARKAPAGAVEAARRLLELSREPVVGAVLSRTMHALVDLAAGLGRREAGEAAGERSDLAALLRLLESSAVAGRLEQVDPLADARLRWIRDRERLLCAEGQPLAAREVGDLLGVTRQAVAKARAAGRLVGLPTGRGTYLYPSWQFDRDGALHGLRAVREALDDADPWTLTAFMVAPNSRLDGDTPLAALRRGDVEAAVRAARAYGEHGAA